MRLLLGLMAAFLLAIVAQPALAHGDEKHDRPVAEHSESPAIGTDATTGERSADTSVQTDQAGHDARGGTIWTKLHPATVHFPIALLLMAALTEALSMARPSAGLRGSVRVLVWGGAAGAVVAAVFGWIHTGLWLGGTTVMQWHRWTGTILALAAPVAALLSTRDDRAPFRALLFVIAFALLAQGYLGGELAHGPHHLGI